MHKECYATKLGVFKGNLVFGYTRFLSAPTSLFPELDGLELSTGVILLGTTNRPWSLDAAMLRPGRLDDHIYVGGPSLEERQEIFKVCC